MLKRLVIVVVLSFGQILISQNIVDFSINSELFIKQSEQTYISNDGELFLTVETFANQYEDLVADIEGVKDDYKDRLTLEYLEGKSIFSAMLLEKVRGSGDFVSVKLLKDLGSTNTLYLIAAFPLKDKEKYYPILIEAVKSAKLKEK
ncbi:hypothetical protein [uncultured Winogradskyella sp.]|uniref:hypothetical protein n=1 Tax=uncultured Winogradskyella sp. TaxID=395353 RepID=UPI0030EBD865